MNQNEEQILRKYIKRRIAEKNATFAKMTYQYRESAKLMRNNIFVSFARGNNGTFDVTTSNMNLKSIRQDIERTGNKLSPYNYFDLDTLIAYDKYLGIIIEHVEALRRKSQRHYYKIEDFDNAISFTAPKFLLENAGTFETGFYNIVCPVSLLRDANNRLSPERTPDGKAFAKKYSFQYCEDLLQSYLEDKYLSKSSKQQSTEFEDEEDFDFVYNKVKYIIELEETYLDENNCPIKYIKAESAEQGLMLMGFFDASMREYVGYVYDMDNNIIFDRDDSGVSIYPINYINRDGM